MLQAYCLFRREKGAEAEAEAREALSRAEQAGDYETISDTDLLLANYLIDQKKAEQASKAALVMADAHNLPYQRAAALLDLGLIQLRHSHYGDAISIFEEAVRVADHIGAAYLRVA